MPECSSNGAFVTGESPATLVMERELSSHRILQGIGTNREVLKSAGVGMRTGSSDKLRRERTATENRRGEER